VAAFLSVGNASAGSTVCEANKKGRDGLPGLSVVWLLAVDIVNRINFNYTYF